MSLSDTVLRPYNADDFIINVNHHFAYIKIAIQEKCDSRDTFTITINQKPYDYCVKS